MKRQKGQDIVEFALLLPIFLLVLCGIIYCGFMFGDYQTVQGIVRNAAREAAVVGHYTESADPSQPINNYKIIADKYNQILKEQNVITHLYVPDAAGVQVTATNDNNEKPETLFMRSSTWYLPRAMYHFLITCRTLQNSRTRIP